MKVYLLVTLWMFPWRTSSCRLLFLFFNCLGKLPRKCSWDQKKWREAQQHIIQKRPGLLCRPNEKCIHPSFPSAEKWNLLITLILIGIEIFTKVCWPIILQSIMAFIPWIHVQRTHDRLSWWCFWCLCSFIGHFQNELR